MKLLCPGRELWVVVRWPDLANSELILSGIWDWGFCYEATSTLGYGRPIHSEGPSHSGRKGPQEVSSPTSCSEQGQHCLQIRLLCPVGCWKPPWTETAQPVGATCPIVPLALQYLFFLYAQSVLASGFFTQNILQCQMHLNSSSLYPLPIH